MVVIGPCTTGPVNSASTHWDTAQVCSGSEAVDQAPQPESPSSTTQVGSSTKCAAGAQKNLHV